jgi:parvulin-like peptidyl-prolyl isomerase
MVPEFDKVVFEKEVGKVHKVKTQFGWHLVLTTERTGVDETKGSTNTNSKKGGNRLDHNSLKYKALTFINQYIGILGPLFFIGTLWFVGRRMGGEKGPQARASHILVESEAEVDDLLKQIQSAKDTNAKFAELAKSKSKCPSGQKGGDLGSFGRGQMVPQFDKVVFEKELGEIHKVQTQFGWHLVLTTERTGDEKKSN